MKILYIDDDKYSLMLVRKYLERHGYTIITESTSMEINLYIYRHNPDLIIVDYLMWGKNGLKMLEDITMNDSSIPVVLFTGFPGELGVYVDPSAPHDDQAATYCGELGFDGYVEKSWHTAYGRLRDIIQGFENVK